jgi:hypothetical protein
VVGAVGSVRDSFHFRAIAVYSTLFIVIASETEPRPKTAAGGKSYALCSKAP